MEEWMQLRDQQVAELLLTYDALTAEEATARAAYEKLCDERSLVVVKLALAGLSGVKISQMVNLSESRVSQLKKRGQEVWRRRAAEETQGSM